MPLTVKRCVVYSIFRPVLLKFEKYSNDCQMKWWYGRSQQQNNYCSADTKTCLPKGTGVQVSNQWMMRSFELIDGRCMSARKQNNFNSLQRRMNFAMKNLACSYINNLRKCSWIIHIWSNFYDGANITEIIFFCLKREENTKLCCGHDSRLRPSPNFCSVSVLI